MALLVISDDILKNESFMANLRTWLEMEHQGTIEPMDGYTVNGQYFNVQGIDIPLDLNHQITILVTEIVPGSRVYSFKIDNISLFGDNP